jgi:hypothetical protein
MRFFAAGLFPWADPLASGTVQAGGSSKNPWAL